MLKIITLILFVFSVVNIVNAHGDLHKRILKVSEEIKKNPDSAFLYYKRGDLYYQHDTYEEGLKDLKKSGRLGYKNAQQYLLLAKIYFRLEKYNLSLKKVNKILKKYPTNVKAIKLRAEIYFDKGKYKKSAEGFEKVITFSVEPLPENYLDASLAWYSQSTIEGIEEALSLLKEGIDKLGNNIVLYQRLISIATFQENYSLAIEYQKRIIDFSPRKERVYLQLADLQWLKKDYSEAEKSLKRARIHYNKLPERIKTLDNMREFYSELELKEEKLEKKNKQGI